MWVESITHEVPLLLKKPTNSVTLRSLPSVTPEEPPRLGSLGAKKEERLLEYNALSKSKINVVKSGQHNCCDLYIYPMTFDSNKVGTLQISSTFTTVP